MERQNAAGEGRPDALDLKEEQPLDERQRKYLDIAVEKIGFLPNVLAAHAWHAAKFDAFTRFYNELMLADSPLTKLQREMVAVVVSSANRCHYCLAAHGAAVRELSGDPILGERLAHNYRTAELPPRERAMLDFAWALTVSPHTTDGEAREALKANGWDDRAIWDIASVAAFFNMTNRLSTATDLMPNDAYHAQAR